MKIVGWILQGLLIAMFFMAGTMKLATPYEDLIIEQKWAEDYDGLLVKIIGLLEVLAAAGMLLPALFNKGKIWMVYAMYGLMLTMLMASYTHFSRGEYEMIPITIVLFILLLITSQLRRKALKNSNSENSD